MKMKYLTITSLLLSCFVNAQIFVGPNSYMYVKDQFVYATTDVNLSQTTSNIYLRDNGQLLQGTTGAGANVGLGALSVYQEGTENNFQYNYWCSPVGGSNATAGNSVFGITQLGIPSTNLDTRSYTAATILPVTNYDGTSSNGALSIAPYWIWKYIARNMYDPGGATGWISVRDASTINPGEGFTMKGTSGTDTYTPFTGSSANNTGSAQRYDFRGKPNDGNMSVAVANNMFTLVGNPYPSTIDINLFLNDATNSGVINGTVYYWEQANVNSHYIAAYQGGYGKYTIGGGYLAADIWSFYADGTYNTDTSVNGATYARRYPPIGQGFMVMGTGSGSVTMKNSFRNYIKEAAANGSEFAKANNAKSNSASVYNSNSEFYPAIPNLAGIDYTTVRKDDYAPQLRINARVNNTGIIHTALGFRDNYTNGFDYSADARATSDGTPAGFYFILENQPHEFCISIDKFDIDKTHPIGLRSNEQVNFKIKADQLLYGFDPNQAVYIHDKQVDIYYDIKNAEFDMTLPAGDVRDRFEVTFKNGTLKTTDNIANNFDVYENNTNSTLSIKNPNSIALKSCTLFDIAGKTIFTKDNLGSNSQYEFTTSGISEGIYVVKLITLNNEEVTKKISIFNKK